MDCKEIKQTKENKDNFESPLIELLGTGWRTKEELCELLNVSDRQVRSLVSELSMFYPVAFSTKEHSGYFLPERPDKCSTKQLNENIALLEHVVNDLEARVTVLQKRMKPLIAYLEVARKLRNTEGE